MESTSEKSFEKRHIGISKSETGEMLREIDVESIDELIDLTIPAHIRTKKTLDLPAPMSEYEYLKHIRDIAAKNKTFRTFIGQGYYGTVTPSVILRNVFENPGWYTQYTPYQAEIAQGRLEALLNFQTMVCDLTGMPISNASLLDEGTAAAEAMSMFKGIRNKKRKNNPATKFFVDNGVFESTASIMVTRSMPIGVEIVRGDFRDLSLGEEYIGALIQYPAKDGTIHDYRSFVSKCNEEGVLVCVAADILSLALLTPPGEWGAHAVVGSTQRFGIPMGYGGPHAGYFATLEDYKRQMPGRIIGISQDRLGNRALRMALQTREQHIKREKATSNICTAQALLAIMAGMYAVYHGPDGIRHIASRIAEQTTILNRNLCGLGFDIVNYTFFDTLTVQVEDALQEKIRQLAIQKNMNFYYQKGQISISIDETVSDEEITIISGIFAEATGRKSNGVCDYNIGIPEELQRKSDFLTHEVFANYHTETKMMRYLKKLENKDLSLVHSMISLGSCTMKLNAATEMIPVSWPEFADLHPYIPADQAAGYHEVINNLGDYLCEITGMEACSFQPNSGAQGEYTGLLTIRAYHKSKGEDHRDVALIPSSAHGTNPASAVMAGMRVVVVKCDDHGNIDLQDIKAKAEEHKDRLACLMITYPSTHGVFELEVMEICDAIHHHGGLVYMDGANMNAQVGFTNPGTIGADVCHLNLHKTFAIPHGGGGPGVGPICVNGKLKPFLPGHPIIDTGGSQAITSVSSAPYGSASILLISYGYIRLLGAEGLTNVTRYAILNANYMKVRLEKHFPILYTGVNGMAAHEMIVDLRQFKSLKISAEDIAKRLMDYGFHAPTLSFPVSGTIMIEPTESEDKAELDRFCDALISIKGEIDDIASGQLDQEDNVLHNAPHPLYEVSADQWDHPYSRSSAVYPLDYLHDSGKFWPAVARVDNAYGDRHLICTCPPIEEYA